MILCIRTDHPTAYVGVRDNDRTYAEREWPASRQLAKELLRVIDDVVGSAGGWAKVAGIAVFSGPGSFTGLRIGAATANSLAYAKQLPVVGCAGDRWIEEGARRLDSGANDRVVMPAYGADPNITAPKK